MQKRLAARPARTIGAAEAAGLVRSGMWLEYGGIFSQPDLFDAALAARIGELRDVGIRSALTMRPRASIEADPAGAHVHLTSLHFGGYDRKLGDAGRCHYMPVNLGEIPDYYRRFIDPVDIVVIKARPADADGMMNFGPANLYYRAFIERARCVVVETSATIPHAHGVDNGVHVSEVDYLIAGDDAPVPTLPNPPPTEADQAVARLIAAEIEDGACLQIGIGGMPNAVCALLADANVKDLGIHTEMLPDGLAALYRRGLISGARKRLDPGKVVYTFAVGSQALYDTIDGNPDLLCNALDYTNMPHVIMQNPKAVAINSTTQVDLTGQAASEADGPRHISGTGGQAQFVRGAYASDGGKSFICLPSTYDKRGQRRSRIVPQLTPGTTVTTTRADMMYVVTEYGLVNLKGKSAPERARLLIGIAHPEFREELERAAHGMGLLPRGIAPGGPPS
ncbi:acetyl-CoA hydrolase/transferase family protein [Paracraurococcus ruber]|uniref:4-hydroxybutyrate CoA-transferase n=1 Tax=Paracraurococcus ruber TaxID=77675 RepID=A0ABS1CXK8_9PROT|nr:acetyl-CoA hydrolase/transferase C-terminal domain-containing protein [Paracraurococcus ruber]MBK1659273.1 4-hydroxybutyrate CoA-transferase [Paracraurococcus ruber]TDG31929.1 4-hydroxybutyrate CoA-transferase [Paracraurococcus ruber]